MKRSPWSLSVVTVLLLPVIARAGVTPRLAVLPVESRSLAPSMAQTLADVVSAEIARHGLFEVVTAGDVNALLWLQREGERLGCVDAQCVEGPGSAYGADYVLSTHVGVVGIQCHVEMSLIEVMGARSVARSSQWSDNEPEKLARSIRRAAQALTDSLQKPAPFHDDTPATRWPTVEEDPFSPASQHHAATISTQDAVAWATFGAGVVVAGLGGILRHRGMSGAGDDEAAKRQRRAGEAIMGIGAAAILGGLFALGIDAERSGAAPVAVVPAPGPGGGAGGLMAMLGMSF